MRREEKRRGVESDKIQTVIDSMVVRIFSEIGFVPTLEVSVQHHADFEMGVSALAVDAGSGKAHQAEDFALTDRLTGLDRDGREVGVERVVRAAVPKVLDNDIPPVVRRARFPAHVDDVSAGGRAHFIAGIAERVSADRADVNSLMELEVENLSRHRATGPRTKPNWPPCQG